MNLKQSNPDTYSQRMNFAELSGRVFILRQMEICHEIKCQSFMDLWAKMETLRQ